MSKRAIILAGGKGTRLKPYTVALPKPLMPLGNYPILEIVIKQLSKHGFKKITLAVNHQANIIEAFCGKGERWGVEIDYSLETEPLGTIGPLTLIKDLPDDFLVMNGDVLTDLNYSEIFENHIKSQNLLTVTSYYKSQKIDFGVLDIEKDNSIIGFREKPVNKYNVSLGVNILNKKCLNYIPQNQFYGFDNLVLKLISEKEKIKSFKFDGFWLDIGCPDDYLKAIEEFENNVSKFMY